MFSRTGVEGRTYKRTWNSRNITFKVFCLWSSVGVFNLIYISRKLAHVLRSVVPDVVPRFCDREQQGEVGIPW